MIIEPRDPNEHRDPNIRHPRDVVLELWPLILGSISTIGHVPLLWSAGRTPPPVRVAELLCWATSLAIIPVIGVARARSSVSLPGPVAAGAVLMMGCTTTLALLLLPTGERLGIHAWPWDALSVNLTILALARSLRVPLLVSPALAGGIAAIVLASGTTGASSAEVAYFIGEAIFSPYAGASFMYHYRLDTLRRQAAVAARLQADRSVRLAIGAREDNARRLEGIRQQAADLLGEVAAGSSLPLSRQQQRQAQELATQARSELIQASSLTWLIRAQLADPEQPAEALTVLDPHNVSDRLTEHQQSALAALIGVLRAHGRWHHLTLAIGTDDADSHLDRGYGPGLRLVATGGQANDVLLDLTAQRLTSLLPGTLTAEAPDVLLLESNEHTN